MIFVFSAVFLFLTFILILNFWHFVFVIFSFLFLYLLYCTFVFFVFALFRICLFFCQEFYKNNFYLKNVRFRAQACKPIWNWTLLLKNTTIDRIHFWHCCILKKFNWKNFCGYDRSQTCKVALMNRMDEVESEKTQSYSESFFKISIFENLLQDNF